MVGMNEEIMISDKPKSRNTPIPEIGRHIAKIRSSLGYTRADLAKGIGVSLAQINDIENGRQNAKLERLDQIADFLDVPTDYLLIVYHDDFINYAIDGYLYRIKPDVLTSVVTIMDEFVWALQDEADASATKDLFRKTAGTVAKPRKPLMTKDKFKLYRKEMGLSQAQFSKEIGMAYEHYVKYENNIAGAALQTFLRICLFAKKSSECFTRPERLRLVLSENQILLIQRLDRAKKIMLLEILRTVYERTVK